MQFFELLIIIASSITIIFNRILYRYVNKRYVIGFLILILGIHLIAEGPRWQITPAYLLFLVAIITSFRNPERKSSIFLRIIKTIGLAVLLAMAILLPSVFPVFELPSPTGPYAVGTTDILLNSDRPEPITTDEGDQRRFMIKVWYPSTEPGEEMDSYIDKGGRNGFAQKYQLPGWMFNYLDKIETHVYRNTPVAGETFPVLIFSHGYNSKANGYYAILSELASQGYIIFAINHSYESTGSTFPDGSEIYFDYDYAARIEAGTWEKIQPVQEAFRNGLSFEERHPIVEKALTTYFVRDIVERWALDIMDVIDELDNWNKEGLFKGRLEVANVGVFGHSRGGGAAGQSLLVDNRIKAGANLDGVQWGQIVDTVFQKPFLFLSADWPADHEDLNSHAYINKSTSWFYEAKLLKSEHSNFMDIPYMIPVRALSQAGQIDPDLAMKITGRLTTSFFNRHLKNDGTSPVETLDSTYEMLEMNIYKGDSLLLH
ncbi:alpha/beta hydrolase family protein [Fulvivirga sedimenti]|uniref:Platelet-activating factor acetylhydrolase n=1 Tax=Fulvivirga sedimenti TaxID=2879465 RepID=A0A9X1HQP5_9BACT|nr:hypothetical protein [Fulvivirga sedimenti]MCA6075029.1 hypothetical protein [Fulvivirga sedimenti]MCA6076206.1 hypothetical protein [Fulvivirga sedimenti]MCA6077334.1 hypothetical protein [Fulvivirga sedimenti]